MIREALRKFGYTAEETLNFGYAEGGEVAPTEPEVEFQGFGKIQRLYDSAKGVIITEKLDGTNAAIHVRDGRVVGIQSRKRLITPEDDNFGFARWVTDNAEALADVLGDGLHFGEWYGKGIQRGYGIDEKRFALFNVARWEGIHDARVPQLESVPVLFNGSIEDDGLDGAVSVATTFLETQGSLVNPKFRNFEGIVVHFRDSGSSFKHIVNAPGSKKRTRG